MHGTLPNRVKCYAGLIDINSCVPTSVPPFGLLRLKCLEIGGQTIAGIDGSRNSDLVGMRQPPPSMVRLDTQDLAAFQFV